MRSHSDHPHTPLHDFSLLFEAIESDVSSATFEILLQVENQSNALREIEEFLAMPPAQPREGVTTFLSD